MAPAKLVGKDEPFDARTDILERRLEHVHRDLAVGEQLFYPVKYGDAEICLPGAAELGHAVGFQRQDLLIVGMDGAEMEPVLFRRDADLVKGEAEEILSWPVGGDVHGPAGHRCAEQEAEERRGGTGNGHPWNGRHDGFCGKAPCRFPRNRKASARFCCPERSEGRSSMER